MAHDDAVKDGAQEHVAVVGASVGAVGVVVGVGVGGIAIRVGAGEGAWYA